MENINRLLYTEGSLTQALSAHLSHPVEVDVLRELTRPCSPEEQACLKDTELWQRDVVLKGPTPLILARTRVPLHSIQNEVPELKALGNQPLGEWLFKQKALQKQSFTVDPLKRQRDTVYQLGKVTIWVQETFIS